MNRAAARRRSSVVISDAVERDSKSISNGETANYRGILAMIGACGCFSANDALTKLAAIYLPVSEIVAIRAAFTLLFAYMIIAARGDRGASLVSPTHI